MHGGRRCLLEGAAAAIAGPAVGLAVEVVPEAAQVVAGELCRRRPAVLGGEVGEAVEAHLVVRQRPGGEVSARPRGDVAARLHEAGDEFGQGEGLGPCSGLCCGYHFSLSPV